MDELRFVSIVFIKLGALGDGTPAFLSTAQAALGTTLKALKDCEGYAIG